MNIENAAKRTGLLATTIRYYESIGLVRPSLQINGYREFSKTDLCKLTLLARARSSGFTLHDCRALLELFEGHDLADADAKELVRVQVSHIDRKIAELETIRVSLSRLAQHSGDEHHPDLGSLVRDWVGTT